MSAVLLVGELGVFVRWIFGTIGIAARLVLVSMLFGTAELVYIY